MKITVKREIKRLHFMLPSLLTVIVVSRDLTYYRTFQNNTSDIG